MKTTFSFGKNGIEVSVPDSYASQLVRSHTASAIKDIPTALADALDDPIGCEPLVKMAAGKRSAAISICDITRPAPNEITLPPLLARLHAAGIPPRVHYHPDRNWTAPLRDGRRNSHHRWTGDCRQVSRCEPRRTRFLRASIAGKHEARNAGLHRRAIHGCRPAHFSRVY